MFFMNLLSVIGAGALAGLLCGFLGSGGGIPLLLFLRRRYAVCPTRAFAVCVTVICALTLVSLLHYRSAGMLSLPEAAPMLLPAAAGGVVGANLLGKLTPRTLTVLFALICLIGGGRMLLF